MKKVLLVTYYWPPSGGAGVQRWLKFCKYLPGYHIQPIVVTVDAGKASYPVTDESLLKEVPEEVQVHHTNTSEPFTLYKRLLGRKQIPYAGFANEGKTTIVKKISRFIRGNFFIPDARKGWNKYAYRKCAELIKQEGIDTVITSSPPHSTQLIGLKLKEEFGVNWIADLRDPWTDIYYYDMMLHTPSAKRLDANYERQVVEKADTVVVVSNAIKESFAAKSNKINADKIAVIPNGYDETDFENITAQPTPNTFTITYTGTLAATYKPDSFFKAVKNIVESNPKLPVKLRFVGKLSPAIEEQLNNMGLGEHLEVIPYVSHKEAIAYLLQSNALLLIIPDVQGAKGILTGKLFEYLASRKPIICIGPADGDAAAIINECGAGNAFERDNNSGIEEYLKELINDPDKENDNTVYRKYSRKLLTETLSGYLASR